MDVLEPSCQNFESALNGFLSELPSHFDTASGFHRSYMGAYFEGSRFQDERRLFRGPNGSAALLISVQQTPEGKPTLSNWGQPLSFLGVPDPSFRKPLTQHLRQLIQDHRIQGYHHRDFHVNGITSPVTDFSFTLPGEVTSKPGFTGWIDLTLPESGLWSRLRKSYRSLVNWGKKNLQYSTYSGPQMDPEVLTICRALHEEAAGRVTRSNDSWECQQELARKEGAFFTLARLEGQPVAFTFISLEQNVALYSCSAAKRDLFDKPLNHGLLWHSILEAQRRGLPLFHLGETMFHTPSLVTPKEQNIALFKRGFATEIRPHLDLHWKAPPA